ncbi:polymorphic toxin-type HINT domain-containing protein [Lacipirellula limnantheis]|uniref:Hint domain-containing protein n=1 Tax=Lacipirellula limnantheis TaxID=2528024 RepID=A0A517U556_9BACT|nr:polymorphic toxin-type HINT domain-containing protein [Lacipirellula limnantheis]QDT75774.1 hypothetical protein I41_50170 [Lacipirellula limnantheis]
MKASFLSGSRWLAAILPLLLAGQSSGAKPQPQPAPPLAAAPDEVQLAKDKYLSPEVLAAARLTSEAIAARLSGDERRRDDLLEQALKLAPDYGPARWQHGEVMFERKWRTPEAVAARVAKDQNYVEYLHRRAPFNATTVSHEELARWCYREGLEYQERFHWVNVLSANPSHPLGRERLHVQPYAGALYAPEQIAAHELKMSAAQQKFDELRPKFLDLCRRVAAGQADEAKPALEELRQVSDLRAMTALESAVAEVNEDVADETALLLSTCVVEALGRVDHPLTTRRLLDYAIFALHPDLRALAGEELKSRPLTDFVPQLMGALTAPIQARINSFVHRGDDFTVMFDANYYQAGPLADVTSSSTHITQVVQIGGIYGPNGSDGPRTRATKVGVESNAAFRAAAARQQVRQANDDIAQRNLRIREVLSNVFEADLGQDPRAYWDSWTAYNELYMPEHPVYQLSDSSQNSYCRIMSCFAPGTIVWTQAGPRPIEHVVVGDMVLAQHPSTGELAYRSVLDRTLRPPAKMVSIDAGGETIVATLGHRFWVQGQGWVMAKQLEQNVGVNGLDGTVRVAGFESVPTTASTEAYNLVIDDFHTFFVGDARVLVHDNSCPQPTASKTPGQVAVAETLAVAATLQTAKPE